MRVAGEDVAVLLRLFLPLCQVAEGRTATADSRWARVIFVAVHTVAAGEAVGRGTMPADHNAFDGCVFLGRLEHSLEPL